MEPLSFQPGEAPCPSATGSALPLDALNPFPNWSLLLTTHQLKFQLSMERQSSFTPFFSGMTKTSVLTQPGGWEASQAQKRQHYPSGDGSCQLNPWKCSKKTQVFNVSAGEM